MKEQTDESNGLSIPMIQEELKKYNVMANRQVLYEDFKALTEFGSEIKKYGNGSKTRYYMAEEKFKSAELKLLIDAVQASKFLTKRKTDDLIRKLNRINNSTEDESLLNRQVYVAGRIKNMNNSIYDTIDVLHEAIYSNKMVTFQYFSWNVKKEMELRHDGAYYEVSPWALFWDSDKYYLVAYDFKDRIIKHYRVDKMLNVSLTDKKRKGVTAFEKLDKSTYTQMHFSMFGGEKETVTLECSNDMANVIIDRFGMDIDIKPVSDDKFRVDVEVIMSDKFLSWVISLGEGCKVVGPDEAVKKVKVVGNRINSEYE
ncbi:MAG: WYL domain-containing protein [Lachnospiraceae bacterium]|nr:WYL domain-containing protein [Lachnospiraceae bacterium]